MAPLIAFDPITLYPPSEEVDEHGWRLPGVAPYWQGMGNLQQAPGISNVRAADGGGSGPFGPARDRFGQVFLPAKMTLLEGSIAECRGRYYFLSQCHFAGDPTGTGDGTAPLDCWTAAVTTFDTWPEVVTPQPTSEGLSEPSRGL